MQDDVELVNVDFKIGENSNNKTEDITNMQMQDDQLAVEEGGFAGEHPSRTSAGAELVYLGTTSVGATLRRQPPIDVDVVKVEIETIADGMSGRDFLATINMRCNTCPVRNSCPIDSDGRTVVE